MNRRWICGDVWMDILPSFDRPQLGLKMALLSDRFDVLVDKHFDRKSELTIWRRIRIDKDKGPKAKLSVLIDDKCVAFPLPDHSLPIKIRFKELQIDYIGHSVITFLSSNQQIWDRKGTNLDLFIFATDHNNIQSIWDVLAREIWPIFATNIRHLAFRNGDHLDNLRSYTSPTILTDLDQLNSIDSGRLFPGGITDDGPNATAGQALSKWLHTPSKMVNRKQLDCNNFLSTPNLEFEWLNSFKETFRRATTSVSYKIQFYLFTATMPIEPFELVNERTNEKLTFGEIISDYWLLQRCPIGETAPVKFELRYDNNSGANLNKNHLQAFRWYWPLSPPDHSDEKMFSFPDPVIGGKKKK